jgi:small subunit ribosomal protein S1
MEQTLENVNEQREKMPLEQKTGEDESKETVASYLRKRKSDRIKIYNEEGYDEEEQKMLLKLYEQSLSKVVEGDILKGKIIEIDREKGEVVIDIGFKSPGVVPLNEFREPDSLNVGDEVEVSIEKVEDKEGQIVVSHKRAHFLRVWDRVNKAFESDEVLKGVIIRRIKGGFVVDIDGLLAFLPGSQVDIKPIRDYDAWVGKEIECKVVKINHIAENVVVSRKALVEKELEERKRKFFETVKKGDRVRGTVKAIVDFGVFVDMDGIDGLIHITDLSWGRVNHPSEVVQLDQELEMVVTRVDEVTLPTGEKVKRVSLGLKQLQPHPWDDIDKKYRVGQKVTGKVVAITDYGAFIELEKGIEGLIHISEMSWTQHIKHPSQFVTMGQIVDAVILSLDKEGRKLSLSMKRLEPDPWEKIETKYPVGSRHKGIVRNITNFGVFVELEPGIDGLIHISDLSWTKKIRHPSEIVKKDQEIEVIILGIDKEQRRVTLGHKQIKPDPWGKFEEIYRVGKETEGRIVRIIEKGVIVELPDGVDAFVPISHLIPGQKQIRNIAASFKVGDVLPLRVIEFDKESKKIVLSVSEYFRNKGRQAIREFLSKHPIPPDDAQLKAPETSVGVEAEGEERVFVETNYKPPRLSEDIHPGRDKPQGGKQKQTK